MKSGKFWMLSIVIALLLGWAGTWTPAQNRVVVIPLPEESKSSGTLCNSFGMCFTYIPPGTFYMGSPGSELGRYIDEARHKVTISRGFYMQTTEMTVNQWVSVTGGGMVFDDFMMPKRNVSWEDISFFIAGLNSCGEGTYRLPTEAEWEYAARAGTTAALPNGNLTNLLCSPLDPNLALMGWYCGNSSGSFQRVGQMRPNRWGLFDMHGNIGEWVKDWYDYNYGLNPVGAVTDPTGPATGNSKVVRGGCWFDYARFCRSAARSSIHPEYRGTDVGFRLIRVAP